MSKVIALPDGTVGLESLIIVITLVTMCHYHSYSIQGSSLRGLIPNTVLFAWPDAWRQKRSRKPYW